MPQTLTSKLVASPWRTKFEQVISSARKELRIAAPFYNEDTVRFILTKTGKGVAKYFLLALSEQAVKTRAQSTAAIKMMQDDASCRVKFIKNLHAKFLIADQKHAVVTSSNLTSAGLDSNVEMGVLVDDLPIVEELIQRFDALWPRSQTVSKAILDEYDNLPTTPQGGKAGKSFGEVVRFGKQPKHPLAIGTVAPGWILIHSSKVYGVGNDFNSPQDELAKWYEPGRPVTWHWTLPRPLKPGGPVHSPACLRAEDFRKGGGGHYARHREGRAPALLLCICAEELQTAQEGDSICRIAVGKSCSLAPKSD